MSDFMTRLVDRQTGAATVIQPRLSSMFAPPVLRAGPVDPPGIDAPPPLERATHTVVESPPASDRKGDVPVQTAQQHERMVPGSQIIPPASGKPRHVESAPTPLVRNAPRGPSRPADETPAVPRAGSAGIPEHRSRPQLELSGRIIEDRADSAPMLPAAGIEPPPRLVETRQETPRPAAAAPPSLLSGMVTRRRAEPQHAASTESPVEVTIGRIEVTALSAAADQKRKPASRRPAMSLDDYLARRQGGTL